MFPVEIIPNIYILKTANFIWINNSKNPLELAYHKFLQLFFSFDFPADFAISLNDNPYILHFDVHAALVEWEVNMFIFNTDSFITGTHHLERVVVGIDLCDCTKLCSNWFVPVFLKGAVILICCLRWATTEISLYLNALSSIGGKWWPGLVAFKVSGTNKTTLSLEIFLSSRLKHLIVWSPWPAVKHKSIAILLKNVFRSQFVRVDFDLIKVKTLAKFQVVTNLGKAGLILKIPFEKSVYQS